MAQRDPTNDLQDIRRLKSDRKFSKYRSRKFVESSEEFWLAFWVYLDEFLQKVLWFKTIGLLRKEIRGL